MTNQFELYREAKELFEEVELMLFLIDEHNDPYVETLDFALAFRKMPGRIVAHLKKYEGVDAAEAVWRLGDALAHAQVKLELVAKEMKAIEDNQKNAKPWLIED